MKEDCSGEIYMFMLIKLFETVTNQNVKIIRPEVKLLEKMTRYGYLPWLSET